MVTGHGYHGYQRVNRQPFDFGLVQGRCPLISLWPVMGQAFSPASVIAAVTCDTVLFSEMEGKVGREQSGFWGMSFYYLIKKSMSITRRFFSALLLSSYSQFPALEDNYDFWSLKL